ncbi:MAG: acyl-homoserine-lactone synthase [Lentilitoribacter sp.]
MFITLQAHEYHKYESLLQQMYRLRKKVFFDQLNWDVPVSGDIEKDTYDEANPVYLVWCDDDKMKLYGAVRLMPTTGPTLLYDVFRNTFPDLTSFEAPGIWEGTRMCIDQKLILKDHPNIEPGQAFSILLLALCEVAIKHGIHTMVSNYEPQMKRVYRRAGIEVNELGRSADYGKYPVCCSTFEVSKQVLEKMRMKMGIKQPFYQAAHPKRSIADYALEAA